MTGAPSASTSPKQSRLETATYTLSDFAQLLGISYTVAHEMAQAGTLPIQPIRVGRKYLFPRRFVDRALGIEADGAEPVTATN